MLSGPIKFKDFSSRLKNKYLYHFIVVFLSFIKKKQLIKQAPQSVTFAKPVVLTPRQCGGLASVVSQKKTHGKSEAVCHLPESTISFQHLLLKKAIFLLFLRAQTIINASSAWKNQRMLLLFMVKQGIAAVVGPVRKS